MGSVKTTSQIQKIIVNPATSSISVINAGPMGPTGPTGPSEASLVLTVDGDILTRASGTLARITRANLAADTAFSGLYVPRSVLTNDGDIYTRSAGVIDRVTRASLAADVAFSTLYAPAVSPFAPTGAIAESFPRFLVASNVTLAAGTLQLVGLPLVAGQVVNALSFIKGSLLLGTPTNWWFALFSPALALLRQTADQTTTAWAAAVLKTLNLSSSYTVPTTGLYYAGVMCAAATAGNVLGLTAISGGAYNIAPSLSGTSTTGLTTTAPSTAAAISPTSTAMYCFAT